MSAEVAIIVPVLGRPEHAATFMESLRANTPKGSYRVHPICQNTDDCWTWAEQGCAPTTHDGITTFAEKVAWAWGNVLSEPYVLLVGSDVVFRHHWLESALKVAEKTGKGLIATNDLGNPRVLAGRHATHPLISRRYIEEKGASWDGPGSIVHTGYKHNWVDSEWSTKAQLDGEFAFARRSEIVHNHPIWGKAETDWVYELGQKSFQEDKDLFISRVRRFTDLLVNADV